MLVLSRLKDEKLVIGGFGELYAKHGDKFVPLDPIVVMLIELRGDKARIGVEAAKEVTVHREEVYNAIKREKEAGRAKSA